MIRKRCNVQDVVNGFLDYIEKCILPRSILNKWINVVVVVVIMIANVLVNFVFVDIEIKNNYS